MTTFLVEKPPGFGEVRAGPDRSPGKIEKMGYKGVDTTELRLGRSAAAGATRCSAASRAAASTR